MMPAGTYYVGDLCYVMHNEWDEFCELTTNGMTCLEGEFQLADGRRFATFSTAYGDGEYSDQYGNSYPVDAGLIGCILVEDLTEEIRPGTGQVCQFNTDFEVYSENGVITIGSVVIDTAEEYEEEYDEE
jgi:hypothetical protein